MQRIVKNLVYFDGFQKALKIVKKDLQSHIEGVIYSRFRVASQGIVHFWLLLLACLTEYQEKKPA